MFLIFNAFYASGAEARVCFATDPDCGSGGNFGNMDDLKQYDDACKKYNYIYENSCPAEHIKYICPYKSTWLKCCGKQFRYEGCIYPLEIDKSQVGEVIDGVTQYGKCGTRYACKCSDEYEISSEYAETNNCQPGGGYCLQSDGTTDTVKYKTCTCDEDIYTDVGSCKNNQTETSSCKDAQGTVRKKCHCDRGVYPYAACEYGPSVGAKTCIDSNSGREYYSRCKTAEEACREEGFEYNECSRVKNCEHETLTKKVRTTCAKKVLGICVRWNYEYVPETSDNCILGPACPYPVNPGLYKCVFDKASWCTKNNYAQSSSAKLSENSTCTTPDGIQGKVVNCPANDDYSLFYYRCKITCDQRVLKESSVGGLSAESLGKTGHGIGGRFGEVNDINGNAKPNAYWYYLANPKNGFRKGYHLFLRGDARLPENGLSYNANNRNGDNIIRADGNSNNPVYASINGISALYKLDPVTYADCADEYDDMFENPTLTVPLNGKYANNYMFSRDFHNINITLSRYKDDGKTFADWGGNTFKVVRQGHLGGDGNPGPSYATTYIWSNIKMSVDAGLNSSGVGNSEFGDGVSSGMIYMKDRAVINLYQAVKLRFTGKILFDLPASTFASQLIVNPEKSSTSTKDENEKIAASLVDLAFRTQDYAIIEFKDAEVGGSYYSLGGTDSSGKYLEFSGYPDFDSDCSSDGVWDKDGILNIDNSNVSATNHYGCLYLNMKNGSTYNVVRFYSRATDINYGKSASNMNFINRGGQYCRAAAILGNSTFNIKSKHGVTDIRKYLYISGGSKVVSNNPVRLMRGPYSTVCIGDTSSSLIVNVNAGDSSYGKGSHTYDASYSRDYGTNASRYYVGTMSNVSSDKLVMYSRKNGACIPYELNNDPTDKDNVDKNKKNPWRILCTGSTNSSGYNNEKEDKNFDNKMLDEVSMRTPGSFSVKVGSSYSYTTTINSWYPKRKTKYSTRRCDFDKNYGNTESETLNMCGTTTSDSGTEPQYTDGGFDTYISGYNSYKCLNREFLCSGCAYCSAGVGYSDWSDADGGLGTDSVAW